MNNFVIIGIFAVDEAGHNVGIPHHDAELTFFCFSECERLPLFFLADGFGDLREGTGGDDEIQLFFHVQRCVLERQAVSVGSGKRCAPPRRGDFNTGQKRPPLVG